MSIRAFAPATPATRVCLGLALIALTGAATLAGPDETKPQPKPPALDTKSPAQPAKPSESKPSESKPADAANPAPPNTPPEGFTALFDGHSLAGWKGLVADPPKRAKMTQQQLADAQAKADERMKAHWKAEDGILKYDGHGDSLCTAQDYTDFEMLVDWKITKGGDSGIYLRGSPQVQIWDNPLGSGGLYNNKKNPSNPTSVADKPVGEWNTFRIRMVGDKVSVWLNGTLVTDNVTLENYWERNKPIYPTGQIELQNHSTPLEFRNIFLKPLPHDEHKLVPRTPGA